MNIFEGTLKVQSIIDATHDTKLITLSTEGVHLLGNPSQVADFSFQAGQFVSLQFTPTAWRAYSIASAPKEKTLDLLIRIIPEGIASEILRKATPGDLFPFKGPFGGFTLSKTPDATLVFCATGTGIAPLRSMILTEKLKPNARPMILIYGGRNPQDLAYLEEVHDWTPSLDIHIGFSQVEESQLQHSYEFAGRITRFMETTSFPSNAEFYICGNGGMVQSVQELLQKKNIHNTHIHVERFN